MARHAHGGIVARSGTVTIDNLTLFETVQTGGKGSGFFSSQAGGGAGLGGGLLISLAHWSRSTMFKFEGNRAVGGRRQCRGLLAALQAGVIFTGPGYTETPRI